MEKDLVAVLGGGNGGHAVAANLSLAGFKVNFFELPQFADSFEKVLRTKEIQIEGVSIDGMAKLNLATTDIQQAIKDAEVIFVITPAFGHKAMADVCAPFVQDGQMIVLMPGSGGSLEFINIFKQKNNGWLLRLLKKKDNTTSYCDSIIYTLKRKPKRKKSRFITKMLKCWLANSPKKNL